MLLGRIHTGRHVGDGVEAELRNAINPVEAELLAARQSLLDVVLRIGLHARNDARERPMHVLPML